MQKGFGLFFDASGEAPAGHQFEIFLFVLFGQLDFIASLLQLDVLHLAEQFEGGVEIQLQVVVGVEIVLANPEETVEELGVERLQIVHGQWFAQHSLVEGQTEAIVDELAVIEGHGDEATDEAKVEQMIRIDRRGRIDLQIVIVLVRVFEETIHRIQRLVRETKEPFASHTAVVQPFFTFEGQRETSTQFTRLALHDVSERVMEQLIATNGQLQLPGGGVRRAKVAELSHLVRETALIVRSAGVAGKVRETDAWVLEGGGLGVVIEEIHLALFGVAHFEAFGKRKVEDVAVHSSGIFPLRGLREMIDEIGSTLIVVHSLPTFGETFFTVLGRCTAVLRLREVAMLELIEHRVTSSVLILPLSDVGQMSSGRRTPSRCSSIVIDVIDTSTLVDPFFPPGWKSDLLQ